MKNVKIITDTCSDLSGELLDKYGIDFCRMNDVYNDEKIPADLRWTSEARHTFYRNLRLGKRIATTSVPVVDFTKTFMKYLDKEIDVVYVGCASVLSESVSSAELVANQLGPKYKDRKIFVVDSLNTSIGEGMLAIEAAILSQQGKTAEEIYQYLLEKRKTMHEFLTTNSIDSLRRYGRVKFSKALLESLMKVKYILFSNENGEQEVIEKIKGKHNNLERIAELAKLNITNSENNYVYIAYSDYSEKTVNELKTLLEQRMSCQIRIVGMCSTVGAAIGPDAIGVWGFGNEIKNRESIIEAE